MLKNTGRILAMCLLCLIARSMVFGADMKVNVSKDRAAVGEKITLSITVEGETDGQPKLPDLSAFDVYSSGVSQSFSFVNGKSSNKTVYMYILIPQREGTFIINPVTLRSGTNTLSSPPIKIEVSGQKQTSLSANTGGAQRTSNNPQMTSPRSSQGNKTKQDLSEQLFAEITVDPSSVYVHEQTLLSLKIYVRDMRLSDVAYTLPAIDNCVVEDMGEEHKYNTVINGLEYTVIEVQKALFPLAAGPVTIDQAKIDCTILVRNTRERTPFFGSIFDTDPFFDSPFNAYERYPVAIQTDPVTFTVKKLPDYTGDARFRDTVGTFTLSASVDADKTVRAGDPVTLTMTVKGEGNIAAIPEPAVTLEGEYKDYPSEYETRILDRSSGIKGEKIFTKIIVPEKEGLLTVKKVASTSFDPAKGRYITSTAGPFEFTVIPAPKGKIELFGKEARPDAKTGEKKPPAQTDIRYIKQVYGPDTFSARALPLILLVFSVSLSVLLPAAALGYRFVKTRVLDDPVYTARKNMNRRISAAKKAMTSAIRQNNTTSFYQAVSTAISLTVLAGIDPSRTSITNQEVVSILSSRGIDDKTRAGISELLNKLDAVQYGALTPDKDSMKHDKGTVMDIVKKIERFV